MSCPLKLDTCLDTDSQWYSLASELVPILNTIPMPCPKGIQERIVAGDRIDLTNHCCVFEDFAATPHGGNVQNKFFNPLFHQRKMILPKGERQKEATIRLEHIRMKSIPS